MTQLKQSSLFETTDTVAATDDKLLALMRRLGIETLPPHETLLIPVERIVVPGVEVLRISQRLVKSIKRVGVLQPPAVELLSGSDIHDPEATWQTIFGRRRVVHARLAGLTVLKCEAYAPGTPQLASLLALIENDQRSAAWIKEVQDLRRLIDEKVGMTPDDLVLFGFDRRTVIERLRIAQLPLPILSVIFAGRMNEAMAKKIAGFKEERQQKLAELVLAGETLSEALIKQTFRKQVNTGFVPLQHALEASMAATALPVTHPLSGATRPTSTGESTGVGAEEGSFSQVMVTLKLFERQLLSSATTQSIRLLTRSLIQQLEMAERDAVPLIYPHVSEVQEACHHV